MNTMKSLAASTLAVVAFAGLSGCVGMSNRDQSIVTAPVWAPWPARC